MLSLGDLYQQKLLSKRHELTRERVESQVRHFSLHLICSKYQLKNMIPAKFLIELTYKRVICCKQVICTKRTCRAYATQSEKPRQKYHDKQASQKWT